MGSRSTAMPPAHGPAQNHLLAAMPDEEFGRLAGHLELVPMRLGDTLHEPGRRLQHAYFPTTAIVSLVHGLECGASAEVAGVGNEGVLGIALFLGTDSSPTSAVVQTAGHGYRLGAGALGVRREGITEAAGRLQDAGHIRYRRGHISVLDRTGLEARTCECYAVVKTEFARLLNDVRYRQFSSIVVSQRPAPGRRIIQAAGIPGL